MKTSRFVKAALVACVVALCVCGLGACSNSSNASTNSSDVAATVNGTEIPEQKVTDQIEQIREQSGLTEDDQWGQFLVENDMTPSSVREQIIDTLTEQEVIMQGAAELGVTVEDSEVDEYVDNMKGNYDDDEAWAKALEQAGFTEDSYRETIKESLYEQKVGDYFEDQQGEVSDEDIVTQAQTYASYYDGAKRSSHILFGVDDTSDEAAMEEAQKQAEEVLARINSGELDFADAAREYSTDESSKENGGDVGWDQLNSFVEEYTDALENLELNQVSEPVTSEYGVHIIKVTEVYNAPEDTSEITSIDQLPEAFRSTIEEMAKSVDANSAYTDWLDEQKEKADIVVNDMPSGLPYDIDLTPYQEESDDESTDEESTDEEAEATDEEAADEDATIEVSEEDLEEGDVEIGADEAVGETETEAVEGEAADETAAAGESESSSASASE